MKECAKCVIDWSLRHQTQLISTQKNPQTTNNLLNKWHIYIDFLVSVFLGRFFHPYLAIFESAGVEDFSSELITNNSIFTIPGISVIFRGHCSEHLLGVFFISISCQVLRLFFALVLLSSALLEQSDHWYELSFYFFSDWSIFWILYFKDAFKMKEPIFYRQLCHLRSERLVTLEEENRLWAQISPFYLQDKMEICHIEVAGNT